MDPAGWQLTFVSVLSAFTYTAVLMDKGVEEEMGELDESV